MLDRAATLLADDTVERVAGAPVTLLDTGKYLDDVIDFDGP